MKIKQLFTGWGMYMLLLLLLAGTSYGSQGNTENALNISIKLPASSLELVPDGAYYRVLMNRTGLIGEVGKPDLLVFPANIIIPPATSIHKLSIKEAVWKVVEGKFRIAPAVEPRPVKAGNDRDLHAIENAEAYRSGEPYPQWTVRLTGHGFMRGTRLAQLEIAPLRWTPATGKLEVLSKLELRLDLVAMEHAAGEPCTIQRHRNLRRELHFVQHNVVNPECVQAFLPSGEDNDETLDPIYMPDEPLPEYVIIAPKGAMADAAAGLENWLTKSGLPADVVNLEWILANYTGQSPQKPDDAEKVRNFIVEAYQYYAIEYVFLVGDFDEMPTRLFRSCYASNPEYWDTPTDFYYSDLDGSHNMDGDGVWFERYEDYPEGYVFYEDVHVGRIPAKNGQMVTDYLDKWFSFAFAYENDYQTHILYAGDDVYGCSSTVNKYEDLIDPIVNHPPYVVTKLYCDEWPDIPEWLPLTIENFILYVSQGQGLILHAAHSGYFGMGMGNGLFQNGIYGDDHVEMLTNLDRYGAMYSLGCSVQPWDYDHAIGEDLVMDPGRGLIGSVANSDVGWWPTQMYNLRDFAQSAIGDEVVPISQNMIDAKQTNHWWWNSGGGFYSPWGKCSVNLLGEPSLQIWTALPKGLEIQCSQVRTGQTWQVTVTVMESPSPLPIPVENARVCLSRGNIYEVGYTDAQGIVIFTVHMPSTRVLDVVATAKNYIPEEDTLTLSLFYEEEQMTP